jgi:GntR family transcriptional regulator
MTGYPLSGSPIYSIPLYIQIAEGLISQIEAHELAPGQQLPSERELSLKLSVNRMTLRRALRVLESQGFILRKHGVGTFVAEPKIERQMEEVYRFSRGVQQRGLTPGARIISMEVFMLEAALAEELAVPVSSAAYRIIRLRSINQEPVLIESYTIPLERFPGLLEQDLEGRSIFEIMESEYGVKITRARQSFEPVAASSFEAELLGVEQRAPLMLESRLSFDECGHPVEVGRDRYRGDRFRFVTEAVPFELRPAPQPQIQQGEHG